MGQKLYTIHAHPAMTRSQREPVDNTLSQRTQWLIIAQSFFFNRYAVLVTGSPALISMMDKQHMPLRLIPIAASLMSLISLLDIIAGMIYLRKLAKDLKQRLVQGAQKVTYPPIDGFQMLNGWKNLSAIIVPAVFLILWTWIFFFEVIFRNVQVIINL